MLGAREAVCGDLQVSLVCGELCSGPRGAKKLDIDFLSRPPEESASQGLGSCRD